MRTIEVNGVEAKGTLRGLAVDIQVGEQITGHYTDFLFGNKPWKSEFKLVRVSDTHAEVERLGEKHRFTI